jgi:hypothetical protein
LAANHPAGAIIGLPKSGDKGTPSMAEVSYRLASDAACNLPNAPTNSNITSFDPYAAAQLLSRYIVASPGDFMGTLPCFASAASEELAADLVIERFSRVPVIIQQVLQLIHANQLAALPTILHNKSPCSRIGLISLISPFRDPSSAAALRDSPMSVDHVNNAHLIALFQTNLSSCSGNILGVSYRMQIGCIIISTYYFDRMAVISVNIRSIGDKMGNPRGMLSSSSGTASEFVGRRSSHPLSNTGEVGSRRQYKYVSLHDASYWERSFSHDLNLQHTGFIARRWMADEFAAWFPEQKKTGVWVVGAGWKLPRIRYVFLMIHVMHVKAI